MLWRAVVQKNLVRIRKVAAVAAKKAKRKAINK